MTWWNPLTWGSASLSSLPRTVASYEVIADAPLTLAIGADVDRTYEFTLTEVDEGHPVIVSFLLVHAENLLLEVTLNDLSYAYPYAPGPERVIHEVIGAAAREGDNVLTLRVSQGSVRFSDVIVWYGARSLK